MSTVCHEKKLDVWYMMVSKSYFFLHTAQRVLEDNPNKIKAYNKFVQTVR